MSHPATVAASVQELVDRLDAAGVTVPQPSRALWITTSEVASLLGVTPATFRRRLPELQEEQGFPLPSAHRQTPMCWRRAAVMRWLATQGFTTQDLDAVGRGDRRAAAKIHRLNLARGAV